MKAHASLYKYVIRHIRAAAACICKWRQTLAPLHQHGGLNGAFAHVRKVSKSHMVLQIFNWVCINYIREVSNCFYFYSIATKFTLKLLSKIISKIRYSKYCILDHITIEALLYQSLRIMLTFKSNRSMISVANMTCIIWKYILYIFMHPF